MKKQSVKLSVLLILMVLFAAPGVLAYFIYQNPSWLGASRTNKGVLLSPAVQLTFLKPNKQWRLVYWSPKACTQQCIERLELLVRVRLALGRRYYQVEELLLSSEDVVQNMNVLKEKNIQLDVVQQGQLAQSPILGDKAQIFIMNPDNYLVLRYQEDVNPDDIYKDLKVLL